MNQTEFESKLEEALVDSSRTREEFFLGQTKVLDLVLEALEPEA